MVRPVARYRPAARRGGQLEPVYVVTEGTGENQLVKVYRGSTGLVTEFRPFDFDPPVIVTNTDGGMVQRIIDWLTNAYDAQINESEWTGAVTVEIQPFATQLIDSTLYHTIVRGSYVTGRARVSWTVFNPLTGTVLTGGIDETPANRGTVASHELLTVSVDLDSGSTSHAKVQLYNFQYNAGIYVGGGEFLLNTSISYAGLRQAFEQSLPTSHPFKSCGLTPWQAINNTSLSPGSSTYTTAGLTGNSKYRTPPLLQTDRFGVGEGAAEGVAESRLFTPRAFSSFGLGQGSISELTIPRGYSTSGRRVINAGSTNAGFLFELSSMATASQTCENYAALNTFGPQSFADYSPELITPREELLDVSGLLDPADQELLSQEPPGDPPASINPASFPSSNIETSEPIYFRPAAGIPSFANISAVIRYLIPD